jgi:hypothetical protein
MDPIIGILGNPAPIHAIDPSYVNPQFPGEITTSFAFPAEIDEDEAFITITDLRDGMWMNQSHASAPAWVAVNYPLLEDRLANHYGCPKRTVPGLNAPIEE